MTSRQWAGQGGSIATAEALQFIADRATALATRGRDAPIEALGLPPPDTDPLIAPGAVEGVDADNDRMCRQLATRRGISSLGALDGLLD